MNLHVGGFYKEADGAIWACIDRLDFESFPDFFCVMVRTRHGGTPYYDRSTWFDCAGKALSFDTQLVEEIEAGAWL